MDHRHLLEENQQSQALKEFTNLQSMKDLVDWDLFTQPLRRFLAHHRRMVKGTVPGIIRLSSGRYC